ncbi:HAD family hydrolase [Muriicola sp. Z0-33]|uniref:HAD family hydrolase n=1 Tax=Muriicola sp. Z0-33 TaxID=2816957 RepID=UPI002238A9AA|nr:HAD family phosphatase [Muriicola sp. Z0-33]MCW5516524.1 HAD family phosphatase [Muriicola sp. Z0-33]
MIRNIIFDFGDVFINLDKEVVIKAISKYGLKRTSANLTALNNSYEIGKISSAQFLDTLTSSINGVSSQEIQEVWNSMLLDFPDYRLEFLEGLSQSGQYRMYLLSNTNALHIPHVTKIMGQEKFLRFKNCFEGFYLSHEIGMRKPDVEIFEYVLKQHNLIPQETLFIDDTLENTEAAKTLNINAWHLKVGVEDIIDLKSRL